MCLRCCSRSNWSCLCAHINVSSPLSLNCSHRTNLKPQTYQLNWHSASSLTYLSTHTWVCAPLPSETKFTSEIPGSLTKSRGNNYWAALLCYSRFPWHGHILLQRPAWVDAKKHHHPTYILQRKYREYILESIGYFMLHITVWIFHLALD